jgi:hypothetical protein
MPQDPDIEAKIAQMRQVSAAMSGHEVEKSDLPVDDTRGTDANAMLMRGKAPLELLSMEMWGMLELTKEQRDVAIQLLKYFHKTQATTTKVEVSGDAAQATLAGALRQLTDKELDAVEKHMSLSEPQGKPH